MQQQWLSAISARWTNTEVAGLSISEFSLNWQTFLRCRSRCKESVEYILTINQLIIVIRSQIKLPLVTVFITLWGTTWWGVDLHTYVTAARCELPVGQASGVIHHLSLSSRSGWNILTLLVKMSPSCLTMPTFTYTFLAKADLKKIYFKTWYIK